MAKRARQEGAAGGRTVASLGWPGHGAASRGTAWSGPHLVRLGARLGHAWCAWTHVWAAPGAGLARLGAPGSRAKKPWRAGVASWVGSLARGSTAAGLGRGSSADRKGGRRWAQSAPAVGGKEGFGEKDGEGREKVKGKRRKEASRN